MTLSTLYCHSESAEFASPLSRRSVLVNPDPNRHLLPPQQLFSAQAIQSVAKEFMALAEAKTAPFAQATDRDKALLRKLSEVSDLPSYASALDEITSDFDPKRAGGAVLETLHTGRSQEPGNNRRKPRANPRLPQTAFSKMSAVLLRLWSQDQLALAARWGQETRQFCEISALSAGERVGLLSEIEPSFATLRDKANSARMGGLLYRFSSASIGVSSIDDLTPGAVAPHMLDMLGNRITTLLKLVRVNQRLRHGEAETPQTPLWRGPAGIPRRGDHALSWAGEEKFPDLKEWRSYFLEWISQRASPGPGLRCAEFVLNYLIAHPAVTRSPAEFLHRSYANPSPLGKRLNERLQSKAAHLDVNNLCLEFFNWCLIEKLSALDDEGRPIASPEHWNPLERMSKRARPVQTHRDAIPTRYIREMIKVISDDDFAWPRTIAADYAPRLDPLTGAWGTVWSPVRATAMLLKLLLPLRTYQVRMLDSGELDEQIRENGEWIPNASPLAQKKRRAGALRKFTDRSTGRSNTGFFINTNKTADQGKSADAKGYEIPWEHEQAIKAISDLIAWQKAFNPLDKPQRWDQIRDRDTRKVCSQAELTRRGEIAFLFRDPTAPIVNDPLSASSVMSFWTLLLKELQNRLATRGEAMPDGSPIQFVEQRGQGVKSQGGSRGLAPLYDLHSLRVSLITALATEGGVPIPILSKCIAGHASILMTLYYVKIGAPLINEELAQAQKRMEEAEQDNFKRFIFEREAKEFRPFILTNDEAGFNAISGKKFKSWSIDDKGICPVGGSLCHIGGPKITSNVTASDYGPTPGGPRNCVRCRFFVTGPAFLGGLVAHFNAVGVELMEAAERNRQKETAIQKMEDELFEAGGNDARLLERVKIAQERQEAEMKEVDAIASNWHAVYAFIERSKAILANQQGQTRQLTPQSPPEGPSEASAPEADSGASESPAKLSLVLGGDKHDFSVMMQEATAFEAFNAVCQMSVAYPAEKSVPLASLRRSKLLDAMLARNQCPPVFAALSDDEAIAVGNQLSSLLLAKLGRAETANLIEGRRMLESCGIEQDVKRLVRQHAPMGFLPLIKEPGSSTPQLPQPTAKRAKRINPPKERP